MDWPVFSKCRKPARRLKGEFSGFHARPASAL